MNTNLAVTKTVVITGTTRGLGRAMAARFVEAGWTVVGCGTNPDAVSSLAVDYPAPHRFDVVDVANDVAVGEWATTICREFGAPDLLVNNAAVINENAPLWEVSPADFSRVLTVNVQGTFHVVRHFVPAMIVRGRGVIVNFSSGWGRSTSPEVAPYCASKYAIEGLTQALAQELPQGLAAVALNPGIINTDMLQQCFAEGAANYPAPEEWSRTAVPMLMQLSAKDNGRSLDV